MNSSTLRRKIAVLLLGVSLLASAAVAADMRRPMQPQPFQLLAKLAAFFDFLWEKEGGSLDPDGRPKEGVSLDPWGGEGGGSLDPDGRPTENGASLDPNGVCSQSDCDSTPPQ